MTRPTDEKLMAFADGQLPSNEMTEIQALVEKDPEARRIVEDFRTSAELLRAAFDDALREPPPQRLVDAIEQAPRPAAAHSPEVTEVRRLRDNRAIDPGAATRFRRQPPGRGWTLPLAASIALLVGVGLGTLIGPGKQSAPELSAIALGPVASTTPLGLLLETAPAGTPLDTGRPERQVVAVATFRDRRGRICREIELTSVGTEPASLAAAVACRQAPGGWIVEGAFNLSPPSDAGPQYVPSGTAEKDALEGLLKGLGAGEVLTAKDEAALIGRQWRE